MVFKTASPATWSYTLPEINTADGDMEIVQIFVDVGKATFVTFKKGQLDIKDLSNSLVTLGQYPIKITLQNSTETKTYVITLAITTF